MATTATANLDVSVEKEACPLGLAPTSSTTATLVMGDALAIALLEARGFTAQDFAHSHPGGSLGRRLLLRVKDIMHTGNDMPQVVGEAPLSEALLEITQKRLGMTAVLDAEGKIIGILPTAAQLAHDLQALTLTARLASPTGEAWCRQGLEREAAGDHIQALAYYRHAAAKNEPRAKTNIGVFYLKGLGGLTVDKIQAAYWLQQAAQSGHPRAMFNLAQMLEYGDGVPTDKVEALHWYQQAAKNHYKGAAEKVNALQTRVPPTASIRSQHGAH